MDLPLDATTAELIVGIPIEFSDGGFFADEFAGVAMTLTHNTATTFTATGGGTTLTGTVTYGSCSYFLPGNFLLVFYEDCTIEVTQHPDGSTTGSLDYDGNGSEDYDTGDGSVTVNDDGTCTFTLQNGSFFRGECTVTQATGSSGGSRGLVIP